MTTPADPVAQPVPPADAPAPPAQQAPPPNAPPAPEQPAEAPVADPERYPLADAEPAPDEPRGAPDLVAGDDAPESPSDPAERREAGLYDVPSGTPDWLRRLIDHVDGRVSKLEK